MLRCSELQLYWKHNKNKHSLLLNCRLVNQVDVFTKQNTPEAVLHSQVHSNLSFSVVVYVLAWKLGAYEQGHTVADKRCCPEPLGSIIYLLYRYTHGIIMLIAACLVLD